MQEEYRRFNKKIEVSNLGNVKRDGEPAELHKDKYYYYVYDNGVFIRVHTMVGKCFPEICGEHIKNGHYHHINHNQLDNRAENIRCISNSEHKRLHQIEDGVSVAVKAYDKEGNFIGRWDSKMQAAEATGADYRHISDIVNHPERKRYTAGKLFWFKDSISDEEARKKIIEMQNAKHQSFIESRKRKNCVTTKTGPDFVVNKKRNSVQTALQS